MELAPAPLTQATGEDDQAPAHEGYYGNASHVVEEANDYPPQEVAEGDTDDPHNVVTEGGGGVGGEFYDQRLSSVPYHS